MSDRLSVLVVERDLDTADTLMALLSIWGHGAILTRDVPAALTAMRDRRPDVIIASGSAAGLREGGLGRKRPFLIVIDTDWRKLSVSRADLALLKPSDPGLISRVLDRLAKGRIDRLTDAMSKPLPPDLVALPA
jgi:hypothetical protein